MSAGLGVGLWWWRVKRLTLGGLLVLYLILSVALAIPLFVWNAVSLEGPRASDLLLAFGIGAGILLFPMLFVSGGWWVQQAVARSGGSSRRRWGTLAAYSAAVLGLWVCLRVLGRGLEQGTSIGWLVTLSTLAGYSSYLVPPLATVTGLAALVAVVFSRVKRDQAPAP